MKGLFIGTTSIDIINFLPHFPLENTKNRSLIQLIDIGGPATNAAYTFAALGGEANLISLVGQHPFRSFTLEKMEAYHINHIDLNPKLERNPIISSIIINEQNGSRTINDIAYPKGLELIQPSINLENYDIICIDGFLGEIALDLFNGMKDHIPIVLDGGSYKPYTSELLAHISYAILAERFRLPEEANLMAALQQKGISNIAITRGEKPIKVVEQETAYEIAVPKIKALDTLGAGDIFHGAFTYYILETPGDFKLALEKASKIAALSCQFLGPRTWTQHLS